MKEIDVQLVERGFIDETYEIVYFVKLPSNIDADSAAEFFEKYKGQQLVLSVPKIRKSRSANSYLWVLCQLIAEKTGVTKDDVYVEELKKHSRVFTTLLCIESAIPLLARDYRLIEIMEDVIVDGTVYKQIHAYCGSSAFDQDEMNVLLNGVVQDARELGIPTLEDLEIERIIKQWT